ncbi:MAG: cell surface protein, partial [Alphaproteobacteria bacterium]|nr:cell surface protein [Alphaproteobacteria bacterium]
MKKIVITLTILASFVVHALAYDFQSGNLLYTIISTDPPCVSLSGHVDNTNAQGELVIPETVEYESVNYSVTDIGY